MHLVIDIGNSLVKYAIFEGNNMLLKKALPELSEDFLNELSTTWNISAAIVSSVRRDTDYRALLSQYNFPCIFADSGTPVPVKNVYESPETLGMDRLAAVAAVSDLYPGRQVLVISAGTCLTFDFLTDTNHYPGGSISPGLTMRLKALNHFTGRLPLETAPEGDVPLTGSNTRQAILSGVVNGMIAEIDGIITLYKEQYPNVEVVLSGGDIIFFDKKLKNKIFAIENIVLTGLNKILEHNVQKPH